LACFVLDPFQLNPTPSHDDDEFFFNLPKKRNNQNKQRDKLKKVRQEVTYKERWIKKETLGRVDREYIVLFT
jgi:hypothetical protein